MEILTVLWIVLAILAASAIVYYQYFYKNSRKGSTHKILAGLRFCTLLAAFLLLINPKFTTNEYFLEKANLVLLTDNSSSIGNVVDQDAFLSKLQNLVNDQDLIDRFDIAQYSFGSQLDYNDSLNFDKKNSNLAVALEKIDEIYSNGATAIVMFSDGNQTLGRDYEFLDLDSEISVNSVVVGDTTQYEDIAISYINCNLYAFLNNQFPVEASINYTGQGEISKNVTISMNGKTIFRQRLDFDGDNNSQTINALLEAKSVGVKNIVVQIENLPTEKNTFNNKREVAIEVIDEKTKVAIVSNMPHPDIGALKKSIESNEQRQVSIKTPDKALKEIDDTDLFILYQPTGNFRPLYNRINKSGVGVLTIAGTKTDWNFLNNIQDKFSKENFNQTEDILPVLNKAFRVFGISDFSIENFPPLMDNLGDIELKATHDILMFQRIKGVDLDKPLFSVFNESSKKEAVVFGENIWRWRVQTYRNTQNFEIFDELIGKLMVFLTSDGRKSRLEVEHKLIFENSSDAKIRAYSFDESYNFDPNSSLTIQCSAKNGSFTRELPMLLKGGYFEADLSDFPSGEYSFTVTKKIENTSHSGSFRILEYNPENLLFSANYKKLQRLSKRANGEVFYFDNLAPLREKLVASTQFIPVQKSRQNVVSLIDFRVLLGLIAVTLALEWFLRKYNGLI
ncbi:vWA domain-containing protein [Flagellimonas onchidii]|uniref:vWA domain-containing protein n=1 Tax=Flagellimonas onchidii TaxID=2562684 RepID=UPI0010A64EA8|nr:vWA domain-containing protein [Allomuricauda onchidii]